MSHLLLTLWLLVVPLVGVVFLSYRYDHWGIDTSEAAAAHIRPGMTTQEVERIVGGPPLDYRAPEHKQFRKVSGNQWPYIVEWTTYNGRIEVTDGEWGIERPAGSGYWSTADGIVDSVRWSAVDTPRSNWQLVQAGFWRTLFCFGFTWFAYAALRRGNPGSTPAPPSSEPAS